MFNWERRVNSITKDGSDYKQNRSKQFIRRKVVDQWLAEVEITAEHFFV